MSIYSILACGSSVTGTGFHKSANGLRHVADGLDCVGNWFDNRALALAMKSLSPEQRKACETKKAEEQETPEAEPATQEIKPEDKPEEAQPIGKKIGKAPKGATGDFKLVGDTAI